MRELLLILVFLKCIKSEILADCDEDICCHLGEDIIIFHNNYDSSNIKFECASYNNQKLQYSILKGGSVEHSGISTVSGAVEIDGGKVLGYIHQFRPPRNPGNYTFRVQHQPSSDRILIVRDEPQLNGVYYSSPILNVCGNIHHDVLPSIVDNYSIRLKASGFNQVYKYDTPKRRKRRQTGTDGNSNCVVNFQLTLKNPDRSNLEQKANVQVFSIFQSETGQSTETLIGEIDMTPKSSINDFWGFVKEHWILIAICAAGLFVVIIIITITCVIWKKRRNKSTEEVDYNPANNRQNRPNNRSNNRDWDYR